MRQAIRLDRVPGPAQLKNYTNRFTTPPVFHNALIRCPRGTSNNRKAALLFPFIFWGSLELYENTDALAVVRALRPDEPITLLRPHAATRAARFFVEKFQGKSLYAVKANPSPALLELLWNAGITHFDVASLGEVRLVNKFLPDAKLCFMHPVKSERAIAQAYHNHGVRTFSLDSHDELEKIVRATNGATDLELCVRIRVSSEHAKLSLASKFGADPSEVADLLGRDPSGCGCARHLLPRRQPSHDPRGLCRGDGAGARGNCAGIRNGRYRRRRWRFPLGVSGHGASPARSLFRNVIHDALRRPSDQLFG
jgi:hypothetical protein